MVGLVLLMRYSRTHVEGDGDLYLASTAVFLMEVRNFDNHFRNCRQYSVS